MSAIAGIVRFDGQPVDADRLAAMVRHMRYRGPDGEGVHIHGACGLAHVSLSIIDLAGGVQPMHVLSSQASPQAAPRQNQPMTPANHASALCVVFNGEIYNHLDLRRTLEGLGHRFVTDHSDTEVLLHGYRQWGDSLPKYLKGMFALAIWDESRRRLFLCRDRNGIKPLYVYRCKDGELIFASLVATVRAGLPAAEPARVSPQALATYLRYGYTQRAALIEGVEELAAAHDTAYEADGSVTTTRYWQAPPLSLTTTKLGVVDAVHQLLTDAVRRRLDADVPLGCWLSGGTDSSLIAVIAQRELAERGGGPLRTYSVAMPELGYDESSYSRHVANAIGSKHTQLTADPRPEVVADLQRLIAMIGEPTADMGILPTYWLSQAVRSEVKIALSGDGGDELFGGYDRYLAMGTLRRHRWWLRHLPMRSLSARSQAQASENRVSRRQLASAAAMTQPAAQYQRIIEVFSDEQLRRLGVACDGHDSAAAARGVPHWPDARDPVHAAMRWDLNHSMPFQLLRKLDRASMSVALEVRCPMLDTAVCDLAGHLPPHILMPRNRNKGLLRRLAQRLLPMRIATRGNRGFTLPMGDWFRGPLREALVDRLLGKPLQNLGLKIAGVDRLIDEHHRGHADHTRPLFTLLSLSLWASWLNSREN